MQPNTHNLKWKYERHSCGMCPWLRDHFMDIHICSVIQVMCHSICFIEVSQCYTKFENSRKLEKARQRKSKIQQYLKFWSQSIDALMG